MGFLLKTKDTLVLESIDGEGKKEIALLKFETEDELKSNLVYDHPPA